MDVKTLREIQRREKLSPYLQELGKEFYKELKKYVGEVHSRYVEDSKQGGISKLTMALGEFENIKAIVSDIYETREKKIMNSALYYIKSEEEMKVENLVPEEEEMLRKVIEVLREQREHVLEKIISETDYKFPHESERYQTKNGKRVPVEADAATTDTISKTAMPRGAPQKMTIRMLKDLPPLVGVDGRTYGSFKKEDVVTLPEPNAKVLVNQGAAEYVDFTG